MPDSRGPEPPDGPSEFGEDPEHAGDELSSVVFDEHFVRAAAIHEPSAVERLLAAAPPTPQGPDGTPGTDAPPVAEAPADDIPPLYEPRTDGGFRPGGVDDALRGDRDDGLARTAWWRQSVAWVLALMMGIGVVAMAITAVTPGRGGQSPPGPQPTVGTPVPPPGDRVTGPETHTSPAAVARPCTGPMRTGC